MAEVKNTYSNTGHDLTSLETGLICLGYFGGMVLGQSLVIFLCCLYSNKITYEPGKKKSRTTFYEFCFLFKM